MARVRVKDPDNGAEYTTSADHAASLGLAFTVLGPHGQTHSTARRYRCAEVVR